MNRSVAIAFIITCSFVSVIGAQSPGDTMWTRTFGGVNSEQGNCVEPTRDGGYILVGLSATFGPPAGNVWMVKTDAVGDTEWTRVYGGNGEDIAFYVEQTTDGGYIVAGHTASFGAGNSDIWLLKTDADGDTLWTRTYGGPDWEKSFCVEQTTDGGYAVIGRTKSYGAGGYDFLLVKTDPDGNPEWSKTYGGSADDRGYFLRQTEDGGYILTGETYSFGAGGSDMYLVKTNAIGDTLWTRTYGGTSSDDAACVQVTPDGGYIISGKTFSYGAGRTDMYLVRTDANGDTLWTRTFGGSEDEFGEEVWVTMDGGFITVGRTESFGAGEKDIFVVRTDSSGNALWSNTFGGIDYEYGNSIQQTLDGNFVALGYTGSYGAGLSDFYLVRINGGDWPNVVSIELTPDDPPVTVPRGGSFTYSGTLRNNTDEPYAVDAWIMVDLPNGSRIGPIRQINDVPLAAHEERTIHNIPENVPMGAPLGVYNLIGFCGYYPGMPIDSSFFEVEVIP